MKTKNKAMIIIGIIVTIIGFFEWIPSRYLLPNTPYLGSIWSFLLMVTGIAIILIGMRK
jgi:hypothetical protein